MSPTRRAEQRICLSVPHVTGRELCHVQSAFESNWLTTTGPHISAFEIEFAELTGLPSVALSSGTAGIHLALKLLDIGPGDEVVVPTLTFVATVNPVLYEHATPVFLDSERSSWNLDPNLLAGFLEKRSRTNRLPAALIVVHLFGQSADLEAITRLCQRYEIPMIEDAANSLGAQFQGEPVGTFGDIGVFSFGGNKVVTTTAGGMLVSARQDWVDKARYWSTQARDPGLNYLHSELGYNYRMSNVLAGIGRGQLEVLPLRVQQRRAVFERYRAAFADLPGIEAQREVMGNGAGSREQGVGSKEQVGRRIEVRGRRSGDACHLPLATDHSSSSSSSLHTRWLSCFLIDEAKFGMSQEELIRFLDAANVESRPVWKPMHTQKLYHGYECIGGEVAEELNRRGICLPSSSSLSMAEQQFVIDRVREAHCGNRGTPDAVNHGLRGIHG